MAYSYTNFVTELKERLQKKSDTKLITDTRAGAWINWSIKDIVYNNPGLRDVDKYDKHTWKCATNQYEYDLNDFVEYPVAHLLKLKYIDKSNSNYYTIEPYVGGLDQFDADYPYPLDLGVGIPSYYVRRGNSVELLRAPGSSEAGSAIWVHYSYLPKDISGTGTAVLTNFDECIIANAIVAALRTMGKKNESQEQKAFADLMIHERVEAEQDWDDIDQVADNGP